MPTAADIRFVQAAVKTGYLSRETAQELLQAQKTAEDAAGTRLELKDIAVNRKALTPEQVKGLEEGLGLGAQPRIKQFGPYLVQKKLGQGGMGAVFLATDTRVNVPVALKVLSSALGNNPDYLKRFQREAAVAAAIKHPNVVGCYGIGQEQNIHYMALEYVDGGDVMGLIKQGPVPDARALEIAGQVAEALAAAHAAGIVHRDLKPPNILLMKDGTAKLGDLGLAKAEEDHSVTQTGIAIGTPHYMSPEQANGEKDLDIRADIYSFGATLYHIVCGKPPFEGAKAVVVLSKHVHEQIPSPKDSVPELSDGICHIIEKCMAKAKEDRYQTPAELLEDIRRVQQGQSPATEALALGTSTVQQRALAKTVADRKERRKAGGATGRQKSPLPVVVGVAAVLLVGAVGVWVFRGNAGTPGNAGILPAPGGKALPDKSGTTSAKGRLVVPPLGGSGEPPIDPKKTPAEAGTTNEGLAGIAGMFREAEKYAQEHPEDFREVIDRFETVQKRGEGTEYEFKAKDQAKSWRTKWDEAAKAEFEKRQQAAEAHLQAGRFEEAGKLWNEFPEALATETVRKRVEEEKGKLAELTKSLADQLSSQAEPLLAKEPETLTEAEIKALTGIRDRAKAPPAGLEERQKEVLSSLLEKLEACLEACQSVQAAKAAKAFDDFWDKFSKLVKDRKFEEAEALLASPLVVPASAGSGEHPEPAEAGCAAPSATNKLKEDVRLLKDLFSRAEGNLEPLIGKTIRVGGASMKVTAVRDGRLIAAVGGAETTAGPEKLDPEELLNLGLAKQTDPKTAAHEQFLFQFFFGQPAKAKIALAKAKSQGLELAFYEERLSELEQGQERVRAEKDAAALVAQTESAIKAGKVETAESKLGKLEKEFGQTQAAKTSLAKLREQLSEAQNKAAAMENLIFIPAGKFLYGEGAGQETDLPAFYIAKYETTNAEYDEFKAWVKKETEKGEKGDPHRYCYPGYLPDGKELSEEQLRGLEKVSPEKRVATIQKLGLNGGERAGKGHDNVRWGGDLGKPNHPVVGMDWYDAWAYCRWRGGRLPTEQEWEKAASWDPKLKRKRVYPWGDEFVAKFCNTNSPEDGFAQTCPVNEFPKGVSAYGCHNTAGNVWEWCDSSMDKSGGARINRGGGWDYAAGICRSANRISYSPDSRSSHLGCRVAKSVSQPAGGPFPGERPSSQEQAQPDEQAEKQAEVLVRQIESAIKGGKLETAESKLQDLEQDFAGTRAAQASLDPLRKQLSEAQGKSWAKEDLIFIPASKFIYQDGQEIELPAFYIGKYEISNAEYAEFKVWWKREVEKGEKGDPHQHCYPGYLPDGKDLSEEQLKGLEKMTPEKRLAAVQKLELKGGEPGGKSHENQKYGGDSDKPNHPVVGVDWFDAWAYCRWRGGRLPTEQEWEKAASWDPKLKRKRAYPWGDEFVPKSCNTSSPEDGFAQTCPVNEFPKGVSAYGCFNMAGNVWEWCSSWKEGSGSSRADRGGCWGYAAEIARCGYRHGRGVGYADDRLGFRLAKSLP